MSAQVAGDALAGGPADPRPDFLDRNHQWIDQQHGPADAEAQLCDGLAVSADTGRIVVRSARNEPRAELAQPRAGQIHSRRVLENMDLPEALQGIGLGSSQHLHCELAVDASGRMVEAELQVRWPSITAAEQKLGSMASRCISPK
jgi:hypothetical protein